MSEPYQLLSTGLVQLFQTRHYSPRINCLEDFNKNAKKLTLHRSLDPDNEGRQICQLGQHMVDYIQRPIP